MLNYFRRFTSIQNPLSISLSRSLCLKSHPIPQYRIDAIRKLQESTLEHASPVSQLAQGADAHSWEVLLGYNGQWHALKSHYNSHLPSSCLSYLRTAILGLENSLKTSDSYAKKTCQLVRARIFSVIPKNNQDAKITFAHHYDELPVLHHNISENDASIYVGPDHPEKDNSNSMNSIIVNSGEYIFIPPYTDHGPATTYCSKSRITFNLVQLAHLGMLTKSQIIATFFENPISSPSKRLDRELSSNKMRLLPPSLEL